MGYIIKNKVEYGGVNKVVPNELVFDTYADYTTWRNSSAYDPETTCYIKGGGYAHASNIDYDNSESGLAATNVQGAITELSDKIVKLGTHKSINVETNLVITGDAKNVVSFIVNLSAYDITCLFNVNINNAKWSGTTAQAQASIWNLRLFDWIYNRDTKRLTVTIGKDCVFNTEKIYFTIVYD